MYCVGVLLLLLTDSEHFLEEPVLTGLFLLSVVIPAFVFARHRIRRPTGVAAGHTEPVPVKWGAEAIGAPVNPLGPSRRAGSA